MKLKDLAGSIAFLLIASAVLTGLAAVSIFPASEFVAGRSTSITDNFYVNGGVMALVMLASVAQGFLLIRLIWGPAVASTFSESGDEADDLVEVRAMKVTGTKKAAVLIMVLAVDMFAFDYLGAGTLLSDTRAYRVLTLLRSPDGQDRADAVQDSIMLTGDPRIAKALERVMDNPGEAREWAAYAAGVRHDVGLSGSLVRLLKTGTERERAASAVALARFKDHRLIRLVAEVYPEMGELKGNLIAAMGMLGNLEGTDEQDLKTAGRLMAGLLTEGTLDKELTRVVIWALGRFNAPEGLLPIEALLEKPGDSATLCIGLEALGHIGSASTSPKLIKTIYEIDRSVRCPEMVYADFTGHEVLLCESANIVERLLREIARIGDRRAMPEMEKIAKDESFSKQVRNMAAEIAFQMKYKPLPQQ